MGVVREMEWVSSFLDFGYTNLFMILAGFSAF